MRPRARRALHGAAAQGAHRPGARRAPYPEGTACAEVLLAGEQGGSKAGTVFAGLGLAALYKFIADGLKLFPSEVHYEIGSYRGAGVGVDVLPRCSVSATSAGRASPPI